MVVKHPVHDPPLINAAVRVQPAEVRERSRCHGITRPAGRPTADQNGPARPRRPRRAGAAARSRRTTSGGRAARIDSRYHNSRRLDGPGLMRRRAADRHCTGQRQHANRRHSHTTNCRTHQYSQGLESGPSRTFAVSSQRPLLLTTAHDTTPDHPEKSASFWLCRIRTDVVMPHGRHEECSVVGEVASVLAPGVDPARGVGRKDWTASPWSSWSRLTDCRVYRHRSAASNKVNWAPGCGRSRWRGSAIPVASRKWSPSGPFAQLLSQPSNVSVLNPAGPDDRNSGPPKRRLCLLSAGGPRRAGRSRFATGPRAGA